MNNTFSLTTEALIIQQESRGDPSKRVSNDNSWMKDFLHFLRKRFVDTPESEKDDDAHLISFG